MLLRHNNFLFGTLQRYKACRLSNKSKYEFLTIYLFIIMFLLLLREQLRLVVMRLQLDLVSYDVGVSTEDVWGRRCRDRRGGGVLQRRTTNLWVKCRCPLRPTYAHRHFLHNHVVLWSMNLPRNVKASDCFLYRIANSQTMTMYFLQPILMWSLWLLNYLT